MSDRSAEVLASPVRRALLDLLVRSGERGSTASDLAQQLELHVTTIRFHIDRLLRAHLVSEHDSTPHAVGRPAKIYRAHAVDIAAAPPGRAHGTLAGLLADSLEAARAGTLVSAEQSGVQWARAHVDPAKSADAAPATTAGEWFEVVTQVSGRLTDWGYRPEVTSRGDGRTIEVDLQHCPFLDLARSHPQLVCGIHRGLISATLERLGEPNVDVRLEPFVAPKSCRALLTHPTGFPSSDHATSRRNA